MGWSETKKSPCSLICEQNEKEVKEHESISGGRGRKSISHRGFFTGPRPRGHSTPDISELNWEENEFEFG